MKGLKKAAAVLCTLAILTGACAFVMLRQPPLPEKREVLTEPVPDKNELRAYLEVNGIDESRFFIQYPNEKALKTVPVSQFGASPEAENNADALNAAFVYCKENPGTRLLFDKGIYYVTGQLALEDIKDALIDGNGAEIIYDTGSSFFTLRRCECLEVRGLTFEWNWEKMPLSTSARAVTVKGEKNTLDFIFDSPEYAREDMFYAVSQCDPDTLTYGAKGTYIESYEGQNPDVIKSITKINENTM